MEHLLFRFSGVQASLFFEGAPGPRFLVSLSGMPPGAPLSKHHPAVVEAVSRGWSVLVPSYPGTYDSSGTFSPRQALRMVRRCVAFCEGGTGTELWGDTDVSWRCREVALLGTSFGGALALVATARLHIQRVLAISPVVDWKMELGEDDAELKRIMRRAFPKTMRPGDDWDEWGVVNPADEVKALHHATIFVVAARDDTVVPIAHSEWLAKQVQVSLTRVPEGGHIGPSHVPSRVWTAFLGPRK